MILDARADTVSMNWSGQVAIVGAGPAGMTLARKLAEVAQVILIESGGFENDANQQALLIGECIGLDYPLTQTRVRHFGGSSELWAGYCAVFDPHDFLLRDWVPGSGWPFGIESIEPYYADAARLLNLCEPEFDGRAIASRAGIMLPLDDESIVPSTWRFGTPTMRFGTDLRDAFASSSNITTILYANVVDIRLDPEHSLVTDVLIRTLDGREGRVSADVFVLACGGLETPRLLLNSDKQVRHGVGNANGLVGRCFMEHPHIAIGPLILHDFDILDSWTRRSVYDGNKEFIPCLGLSAKAQEEAQILNARAHIYRTPGMRKDATPKVGLFMEQAPNLKSRVILSDSTDLLGMRRIRLDWHLTELDWITYDKTASALGTAFERIGVGKMNTSIKPTRNRDTILHSNHHLGTTRMSESRERGVVNAECRVHDLSNLYIIGGGVFSTASWANPTFTLMALTFRLADHLRNRVAESR